MSGAAQSVPLAVRVGAAFKRFGSHEVLRGFGLDIAPGEFVALLGASGSGKTTLLRILAELDHVDHGEVLVPRARSVVFQEPRLIPSMRVWRNVVLGQPAAQSGRAAALGALEEVGLAGHADAWPRTLSGGEAQRVALARALVREPALLLLDEPFAALDALTRLRMQELVKQLCARHQPAVLLVTHDVDEAIRLADRAAVLRDGATSLDLAIELEQPRTPADPRFAEIRRTLLEELGVFAAERAPSETRQPLQALA